MKRDFMNTDKKIKQDIAERLLKLDEEVSLCFDNDDTYYENIFSRQTTFKTVCNKIIKSFDRQFIVRNAAKP